jgi:hypothetical protein
LSLNSLAALMTMKTGLVIRSCAFKIRYIEAFVAKIFPVSERYYQLFLR